MIIISYDIHDDLLRNRFVKMITQNMEQSDYNILSMKLEIVNEYWIISRDSREIGLKLITN